MGHPWSCPLFLGLGQALSEADPEMRIHVHVIQPGEEGSGGIQPLQASGKVSWGLQERTTEWLIIAEIHSLSVLGASEVCWEGFAPGLSLSFGWAGHPGGCLSHSRSLQSQLLSPCGLFLRVCVPSYKDTFYWV